jgi:hypothetical protein
MEYMLSQKDILKARIKEARDHWCLEPAFPEDVDLESKVVFLKLAIEKKQLQFKRE